MKILTQDGFKSFSGFEKMNTVESLLRFEFDNNESIDCTRDHAFLLASGKFEKAEALSEGNVLYPDNIIKSINEIFESTAVYDAIEVEDTHSYFTNSVVSHNCNLIYLDEFAFVENDAEFYTSTYPVISSGKTSRVIITSTANGIGNMFHKIWEGAVQETNSYKSFRVDWWDVPGRDEAWKQETINNTSQLQFDQEFGNKFLGSGDTLIDGNHLLKLKAEQPIFTQAFMSVYEKPIEGHEYMAMVDVAQGRGKDYSTMTIIDVSVKPFKQVATYRNNMISPLLLPDIIYKYATTYNEAYVVIESNDQGGVVCNGLYYELEYENVHLESAIKADSIGIRMTKKVKRIGCSHLKDLIEENKLTVVDAETIVELSTFKAKGTSYEADKGCHDDIVMNLVMFGYFVDTPFFQELTDINVKQMIHADNMAMIEQDIVPFGFVNNGLNDLPANVHEEVIWDGTTSNY
jgi:hypothetical protein